jgi:hypothetical protein
MSFHVPENQAVCWSIFWQSVTSDRAILDMGYSVADCDRFKDVAMKRFDAGEPIWSVALEVKMMIDVLGTTDNPYRKEKTPLELARRVVRA